MSSPQGLPPAEGAAPAEVGGGGQVRGILVGHGKMAFGMVDAVERIAGREPGALTALSNDGLSHEALGGEISRLAGDGPAIIFTDLQVGSCAMAARLWSRGGERRTVICGVNLAMLLDFVFHRSMPVDELTNRLLEKGREAIQASVPSAGNGDSAVSG